MWKGVSISFNKKANAECKSYMAEAEGENARGEDRCNGVFYMVH